MLCYRSYFVNLDYVSYLCSRELELSIGAVLPVSKYHLEDLKRKIMSYVQAQNGAVQVLLHDPGYLDGLFQEVQARKPDVPSFLKDFAAFFCSCVKCFSIFSF